MLRPALIVTLFTILGQAVSFLVLIVTAGLFGTTMHMDAFLAAMTLPQYIAAVVLNALGVVVVTTFVRYSATGRLDEAWTVASGVINASLLALGVLALGGVLCARPLLRLTAPGLSPEALSVGTHVAMIVWPMIIPSSAFSLLSGIYQAHGRFGWPAGAPVVGGLTTLALLPVLVPWLGVLGLAVATTAGATVQAAVLFPIAVGRGRFRLTVAWRHTGVREVLRLVTPLVLSGIIVRWTSVVERFLASGLPQGSIARLGYAFLVVTVLAKVLSTGISTVIFPRMALDAAGTDLGGLRRRISLGLRTMWLAMAPVIAIGIVLAPAVVVVVLQRGKFSPADADSVARILRVYLVALVGMCLGTVTGRGFYALQQTRILALLGVLEALAYAVYTAVLASRFGLLGIAWGYVIYFDLSLLWHILILRRGVGNLVGRKLVTSFGRTGVAGVLGAIAAWAATTVIHPPLGQLALAGCAGIAIYVLALLSMRSGEMQLIWNPISARIRMFLSARRTLPT